MELFDQGILAIFYVLILSFEPNDEVFYLLLFRQHVFISAITSFK
jgi:hypothetical protein